MEALSNKRKVIESKPLNFWERAYLPAILQGLSITMKHFFRKPVTISYPEEKRSFQKIFGECTRLSVMRTIKNAAQPADYVRYHARPKLLP